MTCQYVKMTELPTHGLATNLCVFPQFGVMFAAKNSATSNFFSLSCNHLQDSLKKKSPLCQFSRALKGRGTIFILRKGEHYDFRS